MEQTILTVLPETGSKTIVSGIKKCTGNYSHGQYRKEWVKYRRQRD
jgi:hypothetical protein